MKLRIKAVTVSIACTQIRADADEAATYLTKLQMCRNVQINTDKHRYDYRVGCGHEAGHEAVSERVCIFSNSQAIC